MHGQMVWFEQDGEEWCGIVREKITTCMNDYVLVELPDTDKKMLVLKSKIWKIGPVPLQKGIE